MPRKTLFVLANSIKNRLHCVAGREVIDGPGGYQLGAWVRPVSNFGKGELDEAQVQCADGAPVAVMDFAQVSLSHHMSDRCQPENWLIEGKPSWARLNGKFAVPRVESLQEHPLHLWLEPNREPDRVAHDFLCKHPPTQSLFLIRPSSLKLSFWTQYNYFKDYTQRKRRAIFTYNASLYDLSLTDPIATDRYCKAFPAVDQPAYNIAFNPKKLPLICVSMTPEYQDTAFHFKVVAAILAI